MVRSELENVNKKGNRFYLLHQVGTGALELVKKPLKGLCFLCYLITAVLLWLNRDEFLNFTDFGAFAIMLRDMSQLALGIVLVLGVLVLLVVFGTPLDSQRVKDAFLSIGLYDKTGLTPRLISKRKSKKNARVTLWTFDSCNLPLSRWESLMEDIQTALNISITDMRWGKGRRCVIIESVPAQGDLPDFVPWNDNLLSGKEFVLLLGEGYTGPVTVDLTKQHHILIGGQTGSGKSILLKNLIKQSLAKGADVYIADFKHGLDYPRTWKQRCSMCFDEESALEMLTSLVDELKRRLEILETSGFSNIEDYNAFSGEHLSRIIFACDEVAELMDKTGRNKEQKEMIDKITGKIETLARQGRACAINLMLATQRPDAQTLVGQIKGNVSCRICGRADNTLSLIVLDNTDATTMIPKDSRGRFLTNDGEVFQAYWLNATDF